MDACVCGHLHCCGRQALRDSPYSVQFMPAVNVAERVAASPLVYNHYAHKSAEEDFARRAVRRSAWSEAIATNDRALAAATPQQLQRKANERVAAVAAAYANGAKPHLSAVRDRGLAEYFQANVAQEYAAARAGIAAAEAAVAAAVAAVAGTA